MMGSPYFPVQHPFPSFAQEAALQFQGVDFQQEEF